jgi:hypothetical protein
MADFIARTGKLAVSDGSFSDVGGIVSISLKIAHDDIEKTDFDDAGFKAHEYGESQYSVSGEVNLDEADAGQAKIHTAFINKTTLSIRYRPREASGARQYTFTGLVTSFDVSNERNAMGKASFEMISSGAITANTQ